MPQAPNVVQIGYARNDGPVASYTLVLANPPTPGNTMVILTAGSAFGITNSIPPAGWDYVGDGPIASGYYGIAWSRVAEAGDGTNYGIYIGGDSDVYTAVQNAAIIEITGQPALSYYSSTANSTPNVTGMMSANPSPPNPALIMAMFTWDLQVMGSSFAPNSYTLQHQYGDGTNTGSPANYAYGAFLTGSGFPPDLPITGTASWSQQPFANGVIAGEVNLPAVNISSDNNPSLVAHSVTFTIDVTGSAGTPTGTVVLHDSIGDFADQVLTLVSGSASYATSALSINSHTITASYSGDGTYAPYSGLFGQSVVERYTPVLTLTSDSNLQFHGVPFTLTFSVGAGAAPVDPTGGLSLSDSLVGALASGAVPSISYTMSAFSPWDVGQHFVLGAYSGDANFLPSTTPSLVQLILTARGGTLYDVPGFSVFGSYTTGGDTNLLSWASFIATPTSCPPDTPVYILWNSDNVVAIGIEGVAGVISTTGSGVYKFAGGFSTTTTLICTAYDSNGNLVTTQEVQIIIT